MFKTLLLISLFGLAPVTTTAQEPAAVLSEETERRQIGVRGTMRIGFAGFLDRSYSSEELLPYFLTAQIDVTRFLTSRIAVRGGVAGQGRFGGDTDPSTSSGADASALHANGGVLFYLTPQSLASLYVGADYWAQLTHRREGDPGSIVGKAGLEATLSSRASFFGEGGFGTAVRRGSEGELPTRLVGQVGIRIRF